MFDKSTLHHAERFAFTAAIALAAQVVCAAQPAPNVGIFQPGNGAVPAPWSVIQLDKKVSPTRYRLDMWDGVPAIRADAKASMALMAPRMYSTEPSSSSGPVPWPLPCTLSIISYPTAEFGPAPCCMVTAL